MPHLIPKVLAALPYVDRKPVPDERPDQKRIEWIRVGECLGAAETIIDNSGEMNRAGVQVQKNAVTLFNNEEIIAESLQEIITRVNSHDDALGQIGDDNLATKVEALEVQIEPLDAEIKLNSQKIFVLEEAQTEIESTIGEREADDLTLRNVMADLAFIKRDQLGSWTNKNFNDDANPGVEATGIKYRIEQQGLAIGGNTRRIVALEDNWINSDVGQLKADIDQIRVEVGPSALAPANNIYSWIISANATHTALQKNIDDINDEIGDAGGGTINQRIQAVENRSTTNESTINRHQINIDGIIATIGDKTTETTIDYRLNVVEIASDKHKNTLYGPTGNNGIVEIVQSIGTQIGSDNVPDSIKGRLKAEETSSLLVQQDISTLKTQIGNNTVGTETGIYRRLKDLETGSGTVDGELTDIRTELANKIDDAPSDDQIYVRKNATWVGFDSVVTTGGWYTLNSESTTTADATEIPLIFPAVTAYTFNSLIDITDNKLKYTGETEKVCEVKFDIKVKSTNAKKTTFTLMKNGATPIFTYVIEADEWSPVSKVSRVVFSAPTLVVKNDEFTIHILSEEADVITVDGAHANLVQLV